MYYECMNDSNSFTEYVKNTAEGSRKYFAFCNSLNNVGQDNSNAIYDALGKEIDLFLTCNQMPYQQKKVFVQFVAVACLARLCGLKV